MIFRTRGIVFQRFKYSESSIIAKIYTAQFGLCSFLVQGARKKTSSAKANLLQPLSLIELVAYHKETSGLQKVKEIKNEFPLHSVQNDIAKTAIALFLSEMLVRSIREENPNRPLFEFLHNSIQVLDSIGNPSNFHLAFLVKLTKFLGFSPHENDINPSRNTKKGIANPPGVIGKAANPLPSHKLDRALFFNLKEGLFENEKPNHPYFLAPDLSGIFFQMISMEIMDSANFSMNGKTRKALLEKIIEYYRFHLTGIQEIKSHAILETVLRNGNPPVED